MRQSQDQINDIPYLFIHKCYRQYGPSKHAMLLAVVFRIVSHGSLLFVSSTNVKNVTILGVVISPRQMSQHQSQHQQQTSKNDKRH